MKGFNCKQGLHKHLDKIILDGFIDDADAYHYHMDVDGTNLELDLDSRDSYLVATLTDANIKNDFDFID